MNLVRATEARQSDLPPCDWVRPFQMVLVEWFDEHGRDFPWRQTCLGTHAIQGCTLKF